MDAVVFGNVTLDVICRTVNEVPRYESIAFDDVVLSPGGCASNVAIGLGCLGISTALICRMGADDAAEMIQKTWLKFGLDLRFVQQKANWKTAVSIGLVDNEAQPRFIHTPGANATLTSIDLDVDRIVAEGARLVHVAGFFVLPGLLDGKLPYQLEIAQKQGLTTCLDVVYSPRYWKPEYLWPCLPVIDFFMCNRKEAEKLTGESQADNAACFFKNRGAQVVIIKLGGDGCYVNSEDYVGIKQAPKVNVVDTTGAGDAFAAGLIAALLDNKGIEKSVEAGNDAGALMVSAPGAIGGWINKINLPVN
jgi:sugar/nucleoside kinase (ribokinase family)